MKRTLVASGCEKKSVLFFLKRVEDVLVDHVAAGVVEPSPLLPLLDIRHERKFHGNARHVAEHLLEFLLLGMHEQCVRDLCRAEFLALAAVDTAVGYVGVPDQVEHEGDREFAGRHIRGVLGGAVHTVADRALVDALVALDAAGGLAHDLL